MAGVRADPTWAPVAFGRRAVPQLFEELQKPEPGRRLRALASLCDLVHDPELLYQAVNGGNTELYQAVNGGFMEQLAVLLEDEDPLVKVKTCELLHQLTAHSAGRTSVHRVLNRLALLPAGAESLLSLVPKLMLKLRHEEDEEEEEEEEEVQVLLLSTIACCSRLDAQPSLSSDGVSLLRRKLSHRRPDIRREAAAAMMALSVPVDGKRQVCEEEELLPVLLHLLQDEDVDVRTNAAGVIMNVAIITAGKQRCLGLDVITVLLSLLSEEEQEEEKRRRRKALVVYSLRALTALAEAPDGRHLLLEHLPLLVRRSQDAEEDQEVRRAAQTAVEVVTWTP
ncbi:radial spoke head 14 homolog isoform X3 [Brachyistius frenatus]|uniref:radial spoke head 14 homolog isoform X3 n=1 Tax=Brachyistius frenatus TaxID=100188 RepID=UPI0037E8F550